MDSLWILWCNCKFRSMDFTFFSSVLLIFIIDLHLFFMQPEIITLALDS